MKVLLVGPVSYVGGVSTHLHRLYALMSESAGFQILNDSPRSLDPFYPNLRNYRDALVNLKLLLGSDVVHIHSGHWLVRVAIVLIARFFAKSVVVTLHSFRDSGFRIFLSRCVLRMACRIICVSEEVQAAVKIPDRTIVKEAFLPPNRADFEPLPNDIDCLLSQLSDRVIICANAYKLTSFQGEDLYGLDQCINVARIAKERGSKIFLVFVVGTLDAGNAFEQSAREAIVKYELQDYISIYPRSLSFVSLIERCHIVLRPTRSDGDALTIREALFLGKPVIASDVVQRPEGTMVYKTGDSRDLYRAIEGASYNAGIDQVANQNHAQQSYEKFYLGIYQACSN